MRYGLSFRRAVKALVPAVAIAAAISGEADAHHILGIPHYAYDERYPQTPVLSYRLDAGPYDVRMTGYPGHPQPGDRVSLHVYVTRKHDGGLYAGALTGTVFQDALIGDDVKVYGPVTATLEERLFKFDPVFAEEANYTVRVQFDVEGVPWTIDLPMVAGEPGSPWSVLGGTAAGVSALLIVVRAVRIKRRRAARTSLARADASPA
jgi:hypothetical protein